MLEKLLNAGKKIGIGGLIYGLCSFGNINAQDLNYSIEEYRNCPIEVYPKDGKKLPWDNTEKILLGSYTLLNALDVYQTANMPKNYREANPLIRSWNGDQPTLGEILLWKALLSTVTFYALNKIDEHKERKIALGLSNLFLTGVILNNERVSGGILFRF